MAWRVQHTLYNPNRKDTKMQLTKAQLDSVTLDDIKRMRIVKAELAQYDIDSEHPEYLNMARNAMVSDFKGKALKNFISLLVKNCPL